MSGGGGPGGFGFNDHQVPPPLSGQKRGFPFSGRGGSPDHLDGGSFAKLFVGSVPRTATEEDIRPLFEAHGHVVEVALIRDKKTGEQRGCCFIKYATSEEADRAIRALHNQHTLPGGVSPIQVRYADGERERLGAVEYKLFVGSLNKQATVEEVEEIFSKYGQVEDVYLMRDENKQSRGCGFVKYSQRDMALAAINALNGNYTMRGCDQPISVRFADPKRPRQGDSRGPAFGGSRFGPRFEAPAGLGPRPPSNFADPMNDRMLPPNAWRAMHPPNMGPSANPGFHNMGPPLLPRSGDMAWPMDAGDPMSNTRGPVDVPFHGQAPPSSMSQQNFNQSVTQMPPVGQQISPLQKPIQSPQDLPPSLHLYPQAPMPYSQMQNSHRQLNQPQLSPAGHPSQQALAISGQLPASQPHVQHTATSAAIPHTPIEISTQSNTSLTTPKQQQFPASLQQQPLQTHQHSPSQLAQMMSQQTQNLQASFHSSQQAFSQIQKQLQMLQPSGQGLTLQQNVETTKKQWAGIVPQAAASTPAAALAVDVSSSNSAASSAATVVNQNTGQVKCNWTEHTSPQGFKYYYNSATGESQWEKPEELELSDQQKQQQTTSVQQSQIQSQPPVQSAQQVPQMWQVQPHGQLQAQVPLQQQILHPSFSSSYQAYGVTGHQSVQEVGSTPLQASVSSVGDSARYPQGIHASQEWMWKTKQAGV